MNRLRRNRKPLAAVAVAAFMTATLPAPAVQAAMVPTDRMVTAAENQDARDKLNTFLSREDVRQQMQALGVSPEEAKERVAALSDQEVAEIQGKLDSLPAGESFFGVVIGAALIVFLVLLVTDLLGYTNAFEFTNKGSANPNR